MPKTYDKSTSGGAVPAHFYKPKNSSNWYVRLDPSTELKRYCAPTPLRKSTGQSDLKLAKIVGLKMLADQRAEWHRLLESFTRDTAVHRTKVFLDESLVATICHARLHSWLMSDEEDRLTGLTDEDILEIESFAALSDRTMRSILTQGPASASWVDLLDTVFDWCYTLGYELDHSDPYLPKLVREFAKVEKTAQENIRLRNLGEVDGTATPPPPQGPRPRLSDVSDIFYEHKSISNDPKYAGTLLNAWKLFIEHAGDVPLDSVTPQLLYEFFESRMHAASKPWAPTRIRSFGKRALGDAFALAAVKGLMTIPNPIEQLKVLPTLTKQAQKEREKPRFPYTTQQINQIFSSAWYDPNEQKIFRGKMAEDLGARYWIPLIKTLYGTRVREPIQLLCSDVRKQGTIDVISLRVDIEKTPVEVQTTSQSDSIHRSLKNLTSNRELPVHPKLIELGFLDFVATRRLESGPNALLFPSSEPNSNAQKPKPGRAYEQCYLRFVRDRLKMGNGFGSHSFRHFFEDLLRETQASTGAWPTGLSQQLMGRSRTASMDKDFIAREGSEALYGSGYSAKALQKYHGMVDFSALRFPPPFPEWLRKTHSS